MKYSYLGTTGIKVSRLCFGSLTMGPLLAGLAVNEGAALIRRALELGVNFIDTAQCYKNYDYIRHALKGWQGDVVVATKSYDFTRDGMRKSLEEARRDMGLETIAIFLIHQQESALTLAGHRPAIDYLLEAREMGLVRSVGISTHAVEAVRVAAEWPEIDVIHPVYNIQGMGIIDGTREDMLAAVNVAYKAGKGVYVMKALAGGHLIKQSRQALNFVLDVPAVASVAVGMQSMAEVETNTAWVSGYEPEERYLKQINSKERTLIVGDFCQGCGSCVQRCHQGALKLVNGRVTVNKDKCLCCGYCAGACRDFCIKVI